MVNRFRVLAQCHLHGNRRFDNHIVDAEACRFNRCQLAADGVGAAGARHHCGHAGIERLAEAAVHRVDGVDCPQLRRDRVGLFVAVVPLKGQPVLPHAKMRVRID